MFRGPLLSLLACRDAIDKAIHVGDKSGRVNLLCVLTFAYLTGLRTLSKQLANTLLPRAPEFLVMLVSESKVVVVVKDTF